MDSIGTTRKVSKVSIFGRLLLFAAIEGILFAIFHAAFLLYKLGIYFTVGFGILASIGVTTWTAVGIVAGGTAAFWFIWFMSAYILREIRSGQDAPFDGIADRSLF